MLLEGPELRQYLKSAGKKSLLNAHRAATWKMINDWTKTLGGLAHIEDKRKCNTFDNGCEVDHVWPKAVGGPSIIFNAYFMPARGDNYFSDSPMGNAGPKRKEKASYIGEYAVKMDKQVRERR